MSTEQVAISYECVPCEICDGPRPLAGYGSAKCPTCGQEYDYDESESMTLSEEQIEVLRQHYAHQKQ